jgi:hypothetical protein
MLKIALLFLIVLSSSLAAIPQESTGKVVWSFPTAGMNSKKIGEATAWDLGNDFYGVFDTRNKVTYVIVLLPEKLDELIDNVNKAEPNGIPDKAKFKTAIAVEKVVATPSGEINEYLGKREADTFVYYAYRTYTGALIAARLTGTRTVELLAIPKGKRLR